VAFVGGHKDGKDGGEVMARLGSRQAQGGGDAVILQSPAEEETVLVAHPYYCRIQQGVEVITGKTSKFQAQATVLYHGEE